MIYAEQVPEIAQDSDYVDGTLEDAGNKAFRPLFNWIYRAQLRIR